MTVLPFPDRLAQLQSRIKADLESAEQHDEARIDKIVDAATALAEARELLIQDIAFGRWCDEAQFHLDKNDRAALVAMGANPEQLRNVLRASTRRSLRLIYEKEWTSRFPNSGKPGKAEDHAPLIVPPIVPPVSLERQRERQEQKRAEADTRQRLKRAEHEERLRKMAQDQLRWSEEQARRTAEVNKRLEEEVAKAEQSRARAEQLGIQMPRRSGSKFPLTVEEWKQCSLCFHPSANPSPEVKERLMVLWNNKKKVLTGED